MSGRRQPGQGWQGAGSWSGARETVFRPGGQAGAGSPGERGRRRVGPSGASQLLSDSPGWASHLSFLSDCPSSFPLAVPPSTVCPYCSLLDKRLSFPFHQVHAYSLLDSQRRQSSKKAPLPRSLLVPLRSHAWYSPPGPLFGGLHVCDCMSVVSLSRRC